MKFREVIQVIERDGWRLTRTQGSHRQFKRSIKPGTVTRAGKPNLRVPPGTLISRWSLHLGRKTGKRVRTMLRVEIGEKSPCPTGVVGSNQRWRKPFGKQVGEQATPKGH